MPQTYSYAGMVRQLGADKDKFEQIPGVIYKTVATRFPGAFLQELASVPRPPVDRGGYRRSVKVMKLPNGARAHSTAPYAAIIEWGRRPGARMPPVRLIAAWLARKGFVKGVGSKRFATESQHRRLLSVAFVVARAIARRGLPARLIFTRAGRVVDGAVREAVARHLRGMGP